MHSIICAAIVVECTVNTLHRQLLAKRYTAVRHCTAVAQVVDSGGSSVNAHKEAERVPNCHTCVCEIALVLDAREA
eukprot:14504-Heterococcus_DN1.PRE.6